MTLARKGAVMGRPSNVVLIDRLAQARAEAEEWQMEVRAAASEMVAAGRRIEFAIAADRPDIALHIAARLQVLGEGYANPPTGDPAA